jgi:DNA-binding MarR family transcriptional regulator
MPGTVTPTQVDILVQTLVRLHRRLRKHSGGTLTPSQASALATVGRHGDMRVGELARREQISKSSATRVTARLEALGMVTRYVDPDDQRTSGVSLAPDGRAYLARAARQAQESLAAQLAALDDDDRGLLVAALPVLERLATTPW